MSGYGQNQVAPTGYGYNIPQQAVTQPTQPTQTTAPSGFQNPFTGGSGRGMGGRIMGYGMNFMRNQGPGQPDRRFGVPSFGPDKYAAMGPYNVLAQDMARGQMGSYGFGGPFQYSPYGGGGPIQGAWPGFGQGGMPGRYQAQPMYAPGTSYGMPGGFFGGSRFGYSGGLNPYGPGSYSAPGSMPFGGGSGMFGGWRNPFASLW